MSSRSEFLGKAYIENVAEDFSVGHWIADSYGDEVTPHGHTDAHIMFITSGDFFTQANGEVKKKHPFMIYNPPNTFHCDRFVSNSGSFFTVSVKANLMEDFYEMTLPQIPTIISNPIPHSIINKLMRECVQGGENSLLTIESFCFEIIGAISGYPIKQQAPKWLKNAFEILQDCYSQELSIKSISREIGVHPIHLTRSFQAFYRCTPGEFVRNRRLQKAAELLISTSLSVVEIALETGFFDQSHLTKHFRRTFGIPPGKFRNISSPSFLNVSDY